MGIFIIMGDFNMVVRKSKVEDIVLGFGLRQINNRGENKIKFCKEHNFIIWVLIKYQVQKSRNKTIHR